MKMLILARGKVVETLGALVRRAGEVADKETIFAEVWPGTRVVESSLTRNISVLRKALDEEEGESLIQTVSKRGYRFIEDVAVEGLRIDPRLDPLRDQARFQEALRRVGS